MRRFSFRDYANPSILVRPSGFRHAEPLNGNNARISWVWNKILLPIIIILAAVLVPCSSLLASGYMVREHSTAALGTAFAGVNSGANDLADIFFNPAALMLHPGSQAYLGFDTLLMKSTFTLKSATNVKGMPIPGNPGGADIAPDVTIPSLYLSLNARHDTQFGLAVNAPWGIKTVQPAGWVGRYHALESDVKSLNITPMLAHRVSPTTTLALGLQFQQIDATLDNAIDFGLIGAGAKIPGSVPGAQDGLAKIQGDDWSQGFLLGLIHEPASGTRLGLSYRSEVRHTLSGTAQFTLDSTGKGATLAAVTGAFKNTGVSADLNTPAVLGLGISHAVSPRWILLFDVTRTFWGKFDELRLRFDNPAQADAITREDWHDTWFFSLGGNYRAGDRWTYRVGVAMDQAPVDDDRRIPRLPTSSNRWLSLGASYKASKNTDIDLGVTHIWFDRGTINLSATTPGNLTAGNLVGEFTTSFTMVGLSVQTRF